MNSDKEHDVYEGDDKLIPGVRKTHGKILTDNDELWGWYKATVHTEQVCRTNYVDPVYFGVTVRNCYPVTYEIKKFSENWKIESTYIPTEWWDIPIQETTIDGLKLELYAVTAGFLFEPNDCLTRSSLRRALESVLIDSWLDGTIEDWLVECDEANNSPTTINRNELVADVAVRLTNQSEWIFLSIMVQSKPWFRGSSSEHEEAYNRAMKVL